MKCSALNIDFNGVRLDPLGSRSPTYERIKFGYPLENVQFLLLSTNVAREWLQIDTDTGLGLDAPVETASRRINISPWSHLG